jgi:hypothetical protein
MVVHRSEVEAKAERERLAALYRATLTGHLTPLEADEMRTLEDRQRGRERSTLLSTGERILG